MLSGISGSLIASAFLEDVVLPELAASAGDGCAHRVRELQRWWRRTERMLGPASSARAVVDVGAVPLLEVLGCQVQHLEPHSGGFIGALQTPGGAAVVLRTTPWGADAGAAWRDAVRAGRMAQTRWGLVYTGPALRVVDASRTWSRRALEFDLRQCIADERSGPALLALIGRMSTSAADGFSALVDRSDAHGVAVCRLLGDGVLEALAALLASLDASGRRDPPEPDGTRVVFDQAVTLVYRLLFLLFAEARSLVPMWHHVYRDAYTIDALCKRATERPHSRGLWRAFQAVSRLAHAGCRAGDLVVTPFNGRLFSPRHTPLAEVARVPDAVVARAVVALATSPGRRGRERVAYSDLGVEQLGAVYERVLEYEPTGPRGARLLTRTSHERKSTGSFYTPRAMTDFLVRRTLHPLVVNKSAGDILQLRVLDPAMGSGAFLVSACQYLAAAVERALIAEGQWGDGDVRGRRADVRRSVAQRCLFGVDLNPMAVQLARLSLWLTTLASDRPLTFLDHHLASGDSLLGARVTDLTSPPQNRQRGRRQSHRDALPLFAGDSAEHFATRVIPDRLRIAIEPADTPAAVHDKENALTRLSAPGTPLARLKRIADLWCASWFWGEDDLSAATFADVAASQTGGASALHEKHRAEILERAAVIAGAHRFFHWELEFPEVFFDAHGHPATDAGFDAVIGNPPWDMLRADTGDKGTRDRAQGERAARLRFFRDSGVYRCESRGHANRYQLFLERALQLARRDGRIGMILPSGLATDQGSATLRRTLMDTVQIDRLVGFDNREGIFPIHRDVKFLLVTGSKGHVTERLTCAFGHSRADWLDELPDASSDDPPRVRAIVLSRSLLETWDPQHLGIPLLTAPEDLQILAQVAASVLRLSDATGWNARFGRELNATEDRHHFTARGTSSDRLVVVEGKHLEPFRVISEASTLTISSALAATLLEPERTFRRARLGYRDVASATNRVTLIAARLPPGTITTHTVFCLKTSLDGNAQYALLALLNSLVANYLVRLQVTTHVTTALMARLPVPRPSVNGDQFRQLASLARALEKTGVTGNEAAYVRINTIAAQLYGLTPQQYEHVVSTFPLLPQSLRDACLNHVRATERTGIAEIKERMKRTQIKSPDRRRK